MMKSIFGKERCLLLNNNSSLRAIKYTEIQVIEAFPKFCKVHITGRSTVYISHEDSEKLQKAYIGILPTEEVV